MHNEDKNTFIIMASIFGGIVATIFIIVSIATFFNAAFSPINEDIRHQTFEKSKAYNEGMVQELQSMQLEYIKSTNEEQKKALRSIILHRYADYSCDQLPKELCEFVASIK